MFRMVRRGTYKPKHTTGTSSYLTKDNTRIQIILFLKSHTVANQNKIKHEAKGLSTQQWNPMKNILDEMCEWKWIEKRASEESQNVTVYSLTNTGQTVADQFIEVRDKFDEFFKLDSFQGFKQG